MTTLTVADIVTEPTAEIYTVTPAVAKRWLARNVRNRPVGQLDVAKYARDMAAGNWKLTGEAIKFDTNGALADGQHRLMAVIKSGASIPMLIVRGVEPEAQNVMDSGRKRSVGDQLTLAGTKNATMIAAAARLALKEPAAGFVTEQTSAHVPTNSEIVAFIEANPRIHRAAEIVGHYYPAFDVQPSALILAWMRLSEIDLEAAGVFFHSIANSATNGQGDPRLALIRRLANARRNKERLNSRDYLSLVFRTWDAWRRGRSVNKFQTESRGSYVQPPKRLA